MQNTYASSQDSDMPKVIHISTEEYAPYTSNTMKHNGIAAHIISEALKTQGITVIYDFYPAKRSYNLAGEGFRDGTLPWVFREDRIAMFYYGEIVMEAGVDGFFHLKDFKFEWDANNVDFSKVSHLRMAGVRGYNYGKDFQEAEKSKIINVHRVTKAEQGFKMIQAGHIQAFYMENIAGFHVLNKLSYQNDFKEIVHTTSDNSKSINYYLLLSKKAKNGKYFLEKMNKGIKLLHQNGQYAKFLKDLKDGKYIIKYQKQ
ncbi:MAG: transporter substrate-binding domain-containing protein [Campylobacteraceae bacterium]|nr:transporter substrate-binding domain-containing protein [Campylobacteraceae bacterium]